jgi:hypothetical protein
MVASAVPKSVASAVQPSVSSVPLLTKAQLGPHVPMSGSQILPVVPRTERDGELPSPSTSNWGSGSTSGTPFNAGSEGAPSVPLMNGALFTPGPIDSHYTNPSETRDPYAKVNNPPTRGMNTFIKFFQNGIALGSQNREGPTAWNTRQAQQRTSVMRFAPPAHGMGFTQQTYTPRLMPQQPNTSKYLPATGTDAYGTGVLNSDTLGAGQTAGGIGGNNYSPVPGPPNTQSTAVTATNPSEPTWG